jgi:hypothetical protein
LLLFVRLFLVFRSYAFRCVLFFYTFLINFLLHVLTYQPLFFISVYLLTVVFIFFSVVYLFLSFIFSLSSYDCFLLFLMFLFFRSFFILSFFYSFKSQGFFKDVCEYSEGMLCLNISLFN